MVYGTGRKNLLRLVAATGMAGSMNCASMADSSPNIIMIHIDDMGYGDLGSYGSDFVRSPNMDRLARDGIRFTDAYSAGPVCSPTRAALMTGQYPVRSGITDFIPGTSPNIWLDPNAFITINEPLQAAGYKTCHIGKWHLDGGHAAGPGAPIHHGFDEVIGNETAFIGPCDFFFPYRYMPHFTEPVVQNPWMSEDEIEFSPDRLFHEAMGFIERNQEHPFFIHLSLYAVHQDFEAPDLLVEEYIKEYEARFGEGSGAIFRRNEEGRRPGWRVILEAGAARNCEPVLAAMITVIDWNVGQLEKKLTELGLLDNTLILIKSDNGGLPVNNNGGLRLGKSWLYEGGIRVPMIAYWPAGIPHPMEIDVPVSTVDLYPTFADLANAPLDPDYPLDGESLVSLLTGTGALERDELYWHYSGLSMNWVARKSTVIRKGDWKCLHFYSGPNPRVELFNLRDDPGEQHELSAQHPEIVEDLMRRINQWREGIGVCIEEDLPRMPRPALDAADE